MMCRGIILCLLVLGVAAGQGRRQGGPAANPQQDALRPPATFQGTIKAIDGGKILLELADGNIMEFRATRKSKFEVAGKDAKLKDLASGQVAEIDGRHVLGAVEAVKVTVKPVQPPRP